MKKYYYFLFLFVFLFSCSKDKDDKADMPVWLQERILADENEIEADPDSYKTLGAWMTYDFRNQVYFEYQNLIFSSMPKVYSFEGTEVVFTQTEYEEFLKGRCCKHIVWRGSSYQDH